MGDDDQGSDQLMTRADRQALLLVYAICCLLILLVLFWAGLVH
jgi:TRAP-type C4-dicarboxylate transport system permease small subunit